MDTLPIKVDHKLQRRIPRWAWGCLISGCVLLLLVALLFPTCACSSREGARLGMCISNERQLGLGILQYAQDYDGRLPAGIQGKGFGWAGQIHGYTTSHSVFKCPDDLTSPGDSNPPLPGFAVSYALNSNLSLRRVKVGQLPNPKKTVLIFEVSGVVAQIDKFDEGRKAGAKSYSATGNGTDGHLRAGIAPAQYETGQIGGRPPLKDKSQMAGPTGWHSDKANYLCADNHVAYLAPKQVSSGADAVGPADAQSGGVTGRAAGAENPAYKATFSTR